MDVAEHWHAYSWVGHERPDDSTRLNPLNGTPPLEIAHWFRKPRKYVVETFSNDVAGRREALQWMKECGEKHQYLAEESFPLADRLKYVEDDLHRGADVVWGYYSTRSRYVSRALVACPRADTPCQYRD